MVRERSGIQMGKSHITAIEGAGYITVLSSDGIAACKVDVGIADARHLASLLRRIALRVERQGLK